MQVGGEGTVRKRKINVKTKAESKSKPTMAELMQDVPQKPLLKKSSNFPQPLVTYRICGFLTWLSIFAILAFAGFGLQYAVRYFALDLAQWQMYAVFLSPTILLNVYLLHSAYSGWKQYFSELPRKIDSKECGLNNTLPQNTLEAVPMSMRPIRMSLWQFIQIEYMLYLPFGLHFAYGVLWFYINSWRFYLGCVKPKFAPARLLGHFLLETTCFFWFKGFTDPKKPHLALFSTKAWGPIRTLGFHQANHILDIDEIKVWVNVKNKTAEKAFVSTNSGSFKIKLHRAACLVVATMGTQGHAWLHAVSTYAMDPQHENNWLRTMSLVSLFFNHMGLDGGLPLIAKRIGRPDWIQSGSLRGYEVADKLPLWDQNNMAGPFMAAVPRFYGTELADQLMPYSRFCAFTNLLYPSFMSIHAKTLAVEQDCQSSPVATEPVALFFQSVLHALDHWNMSQTFTWTGGAHASWLDIRRQVVADNCEYDDGEPRIDYKGLADSAAWVLVLTDDFPHMANVYAHNSPVYFYRQLYQKAILLDPELAYNLQCCIIK